MVQCFLSDFHLTVGFITVGEYFFKYDLVLFLPYCDFI
jgi:hypothetical protein